MLRGLTTRGHRVTAFAPCPDPRDRAEAKRIFPEPEYEVHFFDYARLGRAASKLAAFTRPQSYLHSRELAAALNRRLDAPYDVIHIEQHWSGWLARQARPRTIVNVHWLFRLDCETSRVQGLIERARFKRTCDAEITLLRSFPRICTLTPEISEEVRAIHPKAAVSTVPFGIDLENYPFVRDPIDVNPVVTLIGSFDWLPTRMAGIRLLTRLWPAIQAQVPVARLQIVGRNALSVLSSYVDRPGVTIHENVPDILPYFRQAKLLLYPPERASGMKVKVLESFALGLPVVTTRSGVEGIPAIDGLHAGVCQEDSGLIDRCVHLLQNREAWLRQRLAARELLERQCATDPVLDAWEGLYENMLAGVH